MQRARRKRHSMYRELHQPVDTLDGVLVNLGGYREGQNRTDHLTKENRSYSALCGRRIRETSEDFQKT